MRRIKIIKDYKQYKKGQTVMVTPNIAHGLIDSGVAQLTKDMTPTDYKTKEVKHGKSVPQVRTMRKKVPRLR